jgi:hypothetical protein
MLMTLTLEGHHKLERARKQKYDGYVRKLIRVLKLRGIKVIEIKPMRDGLYFYHYHLLVDSAYIPQKKVSKIWREISGSYVVDVRRVTMNAGLGYLVRRSASPLIVGQIGQAKLNGQIEIETKYILSLYARHVYKSRFYSAFGFERFEKEKESFFCPACRSQMVYDYTEDVIEEVFCGGKIALTLSDSHRDRSVLFL